MKNYVWKPTSRLFAYTINITQGGKPGLAALVRLPDGDWVLDIVVAAIKVNGEPTWNKYRSYFQVASPYSAFSQANAEMMRDKMFPVEESK